MSAALLATKLFIPPARPKAVLRPQLFKRLNQGLDNKLILISAPAGFGKTTLLSEWVASCSLPVAWLSLDEGDSDPSRFIAYLVASLQTLAPNIGARVLAVLQSPQLPPLEQILTALLNEITTIAGNIVLVLDDYHVIESPPIDKARSRGCHLSARALATTDAPGHCDPRGSTTSIGSVTRPEPIDRTARHGLAFYLLRSR